MTIGDVLAIIAGSVAICVSAWTLFIGMALVFQERSKAASVFVQRAPWRCLGIGLFLVATVGLGSIVLIALPLPAAKLVGWFSLMILLSVGALGASGICLMIAGRIQLLSSEISGFSSISRAAMLVVVSCIVPLVGWFVIAPLLIVSSLGLGLQAILVRPKVLEPTAPPARVDV